VCDVSRIVVVVVVVDRAPKEAEAQLKSIERAKSGALKVVRFFDADVQKQLFLLSVRMPRYYYQRVD
jgi:hypothetical protein